MAFTFNTDDVEHSGLRPVLLNGSMMRSRGKVFSTILTVVRWKASTSSDRSGSKDDARKENEILCTELDSLYREQKKLRQIVEQLARDYEESKGFDPVRRYERLKGMIKRTIMHLRLNPDEPNSAQGPGIGGLAQGCKDYSYQIESARRREEKYSKLSKAELAEENLQLKEQTREMRRKCAVIRDLIDVLQKNYESSKRLAFLHRYTVLKTMIKNIIHDNVV